MIRPSRCFSSGNTSNATRKRQSTLPAETLWFLRLRSSRKPRLCRPCCLPRKDDVGATLVVAPLPADGHSIRRHAVSRGATTRVAPTAGHVGGRRLCAPLQHCGFGRSSNPCRLVEAIDYRAATFILSSE